MLYIYIYMCVCVCGNKPKINNDISQSNDSIEDIVFDISSLTYIKGESSSRKLHCSI